MLIGPWFESQVDICLHAICRLIDEASQCRLYCRTHSFQIQGSNLELFTSSFSEILVYSWYFLPSILFIEALLIPYVMNVGQSLSLIYFLLLDMRHKLKELICRMCSYMMCLNLPNTSCCISQVHTLKQT